MTFSNSGFEHNQSKAKFCQRTPLLVCSGTKAFLPIITRKIIHGIVDISYLTDLLLGDKTPTLYLRHSPNFSALNVLPFPLKLVKIMHYISTDQILHSYTSYYTQSTFNVAYSGMSEEPKKKRMSKAAKLLEEQRRLKRQQRQQQSESNQQQQIQPQQQQQIQPQHQRKQRVRPRAQEDDAPPQQTQKEVQQAQQQVQQAQQQMQQAQQEVGQQPRQEQTRRDEEEKDIVYTVKKRGFRDEGLENLTKSKDLHRKAKEEALLSRLEDEYRFLGGIRLARLSMPNVRSPHNQISIDGMRNKDHVAFPASSQVSPWMCAYFPVHPVHMSRLFERRVKQLNRGVEQPLGWFTTAGHVLIARCKDAGGYKAVVLDLQPVPEHNLVGEMANCKEQRNVVDDAQMFSEEALDNSVLVLKPLGGNRFRVGMWDLRGNGTDYFLAVVGPRSKENFKHALYPMESPPQPEPVAKLTSPSAICTAALGSFPMPCQDVIAQGKYYSLWRMSGGGDDGDEDQDDSLYDDGGDEDSADEGDGDLQ